MGLTAGEEFMVKKTEMLICLTNLSFSVVARITNCTSFSFLTNKSELKDDLLAHNL